MLLSLHVKNLALIEETEVEFAPGLNVLTGETGAGKSILIGSVNLALGAKADSDIIRNGAEYALVELQFSGDERISRKLKEMDLPFEEEIVTVSRKIQPGRSISRINGETVNIRQVKELAELLLDIHGQHEHQSLLHKKKHLEILDAFAGKEAAELLKEVKELFKEKNRIKEEINAQAMDENARKRELALLQFEAQEIAEADLKDGEDEELENRYRRMANSQRIGEALSTAYRFTGGEEEGASGQLGRALRELNSVVSFDQSLEGLSGQLAEIDSLLNDFNREAANYLDDMEFDGADFSVVQERLNVLNHLKEKYGNTILKVLAYGDAVSEKIDKLEDYEHYMES